MALVKDNKLSSSPLRRDVRFLTTLLGDVIREQEGEKIFTRIEEIRILAKKIRENPDSSEHFIEKLMQSMRALSLEETHHCQGLHDLFSAGQYRRRVAEGEKDPLL